MPFYTHSADAFKMCENSCYGQVLDTDAALLGSVPTDYVAPHLAPVSSCPTASTMPATEPPAVPAIPARFNPVAEATTTTKGAVLPTTASPTTTAATDGNGPKFSSGASSRNVVGVIASSLG